MKFINRRRKSGKTTMMIDTAHITGYPIIVYDQARAHCVKEQAKKMGILDVEVYSIREFMKYGNQHHQNVLIDEADAIIRDALNAILKTNVVACTFSIPYEDLSLEEIEKINKEDEE